MHCAKKGATLATIAFLEMTENTRTSGLPGFGRIRPDPKKSPGQLKKLATRTMLVAEELRLNVIAEGSRGVRLDGEVHAALSFDEPGEKPEPLLLTRQAFLLIVCTARIVTAHTVTVTLVPDGY
jgi:hypothetical protein